MQYEKPLQSYIFNLSVLVKKLSHITCTWLKISMGRFGYYSTISIRLLSFWPFDTEIRIDFVFQIN